VTDSAPSTIPLGTSFNLTLTVTASGGTATNVSLAWTPFYGTTFHSITSSTMSCTGGQLTADVCTVASLAPGVTATVTISLEIDATITFQTPLVQADSATATASNASSATARSQVNVTGAPVLQISPFVISGPSIAGPGGIGTVTSNSVTAGQSAQVAITIFNFGTVAAQNVQIVIDPDSDLGPIIASALDQAAGCTGGFQFICHVASLAPKASATFTPTVVAGPTPATATLTGIATSSNAQSYQATASIQIVTAQSDFEALLRASQGKSAINVLAFVSNNFQTNGVANSPATATMTVALSNGVTLTPTTVTNCTNLQGGGTSTLTCQIPAGVNASLFGNISPIASSSFNMSVTASNANPADVNPSNNVASATIVPTALATQNIWVLGKNNQPVISPHVAGVPLVHPQLTSVGASAVAFDLQGNAWTAGTTGVKEFDSSGNLLQAIVSASITAPVAIAIDGNGLIWVANSDGTVAAFANTGIPITATTGGISTGGLNQPNSIAIDNAGSVWVTNSGNNSVTRIFGAAAPVVTPLSQANNTGSFGSRP
jgi:hypothetical protein